jgi:23S rRNA (cytosine1962-C5)-methyltransferase
MQVLTLIPRQTHRCLEGHPWIYRSELSASTEVGHGTVVEIRDERGRFVGRGLGSAHSQIAVRLFTRQERAIDADLLRERLRAAIAYREARWQRPCRRLVNSEGDRLPGLIVDQYHDRLVVQCTTAGMDQRLDLWLELLREAVQPAQIIERNDVAVRTFDQLPLRSGVRHGPADTAITARLGRITANVDLLDPHKTGAYLDQQAAHEAVGGWLPKPGARVLDCFSHLGGFSLHALLAGAAEAVAVDTSAPALALAQAAARTAGVAGRLRTEAADAFDWLRAASTAGERFDLVVLDPPSFTRNREAVPAALRGYKEIHLQAMRMLPPGGGLATFTCSHHIGPDDFRAMIVAAAADLGRELRLEASTGASPDHPVLPAVPETRYLCGYVLTVL